MNILKRILSKIRGEQDIARLIQRGLKVGSNCRLGSCLIDPSHCFHITIGDNVVFGPHVQVLAHDTGTKLFLGYTRVANVTIGSNVFIGAQSVVLPGVRIGDNVIIGAGSVVSRDIPDGSVAAGAPARVIRSLDEYLQQRRSEMTPENTFDGSFTLRNPDFGASHREQLNRACSQSGCLYVE